MLPLAASSLVIGTGLFILARPYAQPGDLALPVTALVNAAMALPFAFRAILPAARQAQADYGRLADSLGMTGANRLRLGHAAPLAPPLGLCRRADRRPVDGRSGGRGAVCR